MVMKNNENKKNHGRRSGKEVAVEEESYKTIDVNDEDSDDDFVESFGSGLRRSGRNKNIDVCQSVKERTMASGSKGKGTKRAMETVGNAGGVKKPKKVKTKTVKGCTYNSSLSIQTRSSPKTLCNTLEYLKPNQKACLEEIGFGGLVDFKVDGIPGKMGVYVVHKFDENLMEMKLAKGSIAITKEKIGHMLGIKNEGVDVQDGTPVKDSDLVRTWLDQYEDPKNIKPADVKFRIRKSDEADMNFKLNFIVLFTTLMGTINHNGTCDWSILEYIKPDTNLANINWCEYLLRALKRCKKTWTMGKKDSFFRGPLTLLTMIYVDGTKAASKIVCRRRPPTKVWTAELLSDREFEDLSSGGFGYGELEEDFVEEEEEPIPMDIKGCVWMLAKYVDNIKNARNGFERTIAVAKNRFPGNETLSELADSYVNSLKFISGLQAEDGQPSMDRSGDINGVGYQEQVNEKVDVGVNVSGEKRKTPEPPNTMIDDTCMSSGFDRPDTIVGLLTQQAFVQVAETVEGERSIDKSNSKTNYMETENQWADMRSFSLNVTQEYEITPVLNNKKLVLAPEPISAYKPEGDVMVRNGKRVVHKSQFDCSPYNERVADVSKRLSSEELQVYQMIFSNGDNDDEVLFKGKSGQQSSRLQLQTLGPADLENNILDTWAEVRNYMEKSKNKDSPARLFLPIFVLDKDNFSDEFRSKNLVAHVESVIGNSSAGMRLNKTDVVFLPVDNLGHRFLIVFDLKYGAVIVFDQKKHDKVVTRKTVRKGEKIPNRVVAEKLHADFGRYVYSKNHYKAGSMIKAELEFGEFEWQTATLRPYAGMFLMRIMETHMGKGMPSWTVKLNTNRVMLDKDLTVLTKRYAATILLSDCNLLKDSFRAKMKKDDGVVAGVDLKKGKLKIKG